MGIIIGTAGHIDHGKSQLVKYLTGTDPDRLKEEKKRGITIELGYVFMPAPDGRIISFIDVPGHEKFVRQMVAGTATVDCFLLVVAADEGIMPQTREHLDILRLLGVEKGIVALTKCDLVDDEMLELIESEIEEYFEDSVFQGTGIFRVSSITGEGMEKLRSALVRLTEETAERQSDGKFRLDVDRVFVLEGFGTIIGGTAIQGSVSVGDELELLPGGGKYRVREMRVNENREVKAGVAGDRIALNLVGLRRDDVQRGSCVAEPGFMKVNSTLDTSLTLLETAEPLKRYQRVRFHTGTAEVIARAVPVRTDVLKPGTTGYVHFQLESPVVSLPGDRFVVRNFSPVVTIGGGTILEINSRKARKKYALERTSHLEALETGDVESILKKLLDDSGKNGITPEDAVKSTMLPRGGILETLRDMDTKGTVAFIEEGQKSHAVKTELFSEACDRLLSNIGKHHKKNPVSPGLTLSEPSRILSEFSQWFVKGVMKYLMESGKLERRDEWLALSDHHVEIPPEYKSAVDALMSEIETADIQGLNIDSVHDAVLARALIERGLLHEITDGILITSGMAEATMDKVARHFGENGFTLGELRDFLGVSRKIGLRWAEFFDRQGWTVRKGDRRSCRFR